MAATFVIGRGKRGNEIPFRRVRGKIGFKKERNKSVENVRGILYGTGRERAREREGRTLGGELNRDR